MLTESDHGFTPWGPWATASFGTAAFCVFIAFQAAYIALVSVSLRPHVHFAAAMIAGSVAGTAAVLLFTALRRPAPISGYLGLRLPALRSLLLWLAVVCGAFLTFGLADAVRYGSAERVSEPLPLAWHILGGLAVVLFFPVFEEFLFRGFLFAGWSRSKLGVTGAIVLIAVIWAAAHAPMGPQRAAGLLVSGLILGLARHKSGSIFVPLAMHILWNLAAISGLA